MKRLLLASGVALASLTGCWPDHGPDYVGLADPPDLKVRQSPNDTIRVGETVTFTAVFRDSLNPKWDVRWNLTSADPSQQFKQGRQVMWSAKGQPRSYFGRVSVTSLDGSSGTSRGFTITLVP